jgi:hypothetical protein
MIARLLAGGLVLALAVSGVGCSCCHKNTRVTAPPCCPPGGAAVTPPPPPPVTSTFPPTGFPAARR